METPIGGDDDDSHLGHFMHAPWRGGRGCMHLRDVTKEVLLDTLTLRQ